MTPLLPQRIMPLGELLTWRNKVQIPLNIELKNQHGRLQDRTIVECVLENIDNANAANMILISSFRHEYLQWVKNAC